MRLHRSSRFGLFARVIVFAGFSILALACEDGTGPSPVGPAAAFLVVSGSGQEDTVAQELPDPLVVRVEDTKGRPVEGQLVNFVVTAGGGSVFAGSAVTNEDGEARERWTLGTSTAEDQRVELRAVDPASGEKVVFGVFEARALPDSPDTLRAVSATQRSGVVGSSIAEPLIVRVADRFGNPVPGAVVAWTTDVEGGVVAPMSEGADSTGASAAQWTLGNTAGGQMAFSSFDTMEVVFTAQAAPGPIADVEIDLDTLRLGTLSSEHQLSASATDEFGNVVDPLLIVWTSTNPAVAEAAPHGWVGSAENGTTIVIASGGDAADSTVVIVQQVADTVILSPSGGVVFVGDSIRFIASAADSNGYPMDVAAGVWSSADTTIAAVSETGVAYGRALGQTAISLTLAGAGASATLQVARRDSIAPSLSVEHPAEQAVARPQIRIVATCSDDDPLGCRRIHVTASGPDISTTVLLDHYAASVDTVVSLAAYDGTEVVIAFQAFDERNSTELNRSVYVESSTALIEEEIVDGVILDVDAGRVLVWDSSEADGSLGVYDRAGGTTETVISGLAQRPPVASLTSHGAIFVDGDASAGEVSEWRDGALLDHGATSPTNSLRVAGDYAFWNIGMELHLLDMGTAARILVSDSAGNTQNDVAANGDVVFWDTSYDIQRYRSGTILPITADDELWNTYPRTDGDGILFRRGPPCCAARDHVLVLSTDTGEAVLAGPSQFQHSAGTDYGIMDGWIAFVRYDDALATKHVWSRAPDGTLVQLGTYPLSGTSIEALGPNGEIVFVSGNRRYFWTATLGGTPRDVGSAFGRVGFVDGVPHVWVGQAVFRVQ